MTPNRRTCLSWIVGGIAATAIVPAESSAQTNKPRTIQIEIKKRKIIAPKKRILVYESESVELRWTTDEPVNCTSMAMTGKYSLSRARSSSCRLPVGPPGGFRLPATAGEPGATGTTR